MNITVHVTVWVRVPGGAHRSREISYLPRCGQALGQAGRMRAPKAGSNRELLSPPGTAGRGLRGQLLQEGGPVQAVATVEGKGSREQAPLTPPRPPSHLGHKAGGGG